MKNLDSIKKKQSTGEPTSEEQTAYYAEEVRTRPMSGDARRRPMTAGKGFIIITSC